MWCDNPMPRHNGSLCECDEDDNINFNETTNWSEDGLIYCNETYKSITEECPDNPCPTNPPTTVAPSTTAEPTTSEPADEPGIRNRHRFI